LNKSQVTKINFAFCINRLLYQKFSSTEGLDKISRLIMNQKVDRGISIWGTISIIIFYC